MPGDKGPGIYIGMNIYGSFIHFHGGKLYGTTKTCHMLCELLKLPNGLNPDMNRADKWDWVYNL